MAATMITTFLQAPPQCVCLPYDFIDCSPHYMYRKVRGALVYNSIDHLCGHRVNLVYALLVLSHTMASFICTQNKAKGRVNSYVFTCMLTQPIGFSPHEAHAHQAFFGWIMPTIRTSEFTVLQIVGLDAAVVRSPPIPRPTGNGPLTLT